MRQKQKPTKTTMKTNRKTQARLGIKEDDATPPRVFVRTTVKKGNTLRGVLKSFAKDRPVLLREMNQAIRKRATRKKP